jgi:pimeloyl-ACP methyl ester carboxylesterase
VVGEAAVFRAGRRGAPALFFVHALGDSAGVFEPLFTTALCASYQLFAPDWSNVRRARPLEAVQLDSLAVSVAETVVQHAPHGLIGLVGHSLGAAIAVRAARRLGRAAGVFSIEGNLTAADAYFSGRAAAFDSPEAYRDHLLALVANLAESAGASGRRDALLRYRESLRRAAPEALWDVGRSAADASRDDGLGREYRALGMPHLYFWSRESTSAATREYLRKHALPNREFSGGHWPMLEQPAETAGRIADFFEPLFLVSQSRAAP